jgi:hypothetical protein
MTTAPPRWYPDPTNPHQLRYWDGSQWTEHVAPVTVSDPASASGTRRFGSRRVGWAALLLCVVAVVAVSVPSVRYAKAENHEGVRLDGSAQHINLPAHRTYGIYVDDADNSGYSEQCTAVDDNGRMIDMRDPSWSMSSSDTEMLDYVFTTGSGALTINCSVPGERVTARPVPNLDALLLGLVGCGIAGSAGAALLITWLVSRPRRQRPNVAAAAGPGA